MAFTAFAHITAKTASADVTEQTAYPEIFTENIYDNLSGISDYAVSSESVGFADGNKIIIVSDDAKTEYEAGYNVRALDCEETDGKVTYYYSDASGKTYSLPDKNETTHTFPSQATFDLTDYVYTERNGKVYVTAYTPEPETTPLESCSKLKAYNDKLYVVKDGKLNELDGTDLSVMEFSYTDFKSAGTILIGDTLLRLRTQASASFVMLDAGAYRTEIDLNDFSGRYFKTGATERAAEGETALLLCTSGNAAIISNGSKCYITLAEKLESITRDTELLPDFENGAVCVPFDYIYSSPALFDGVKIKKVNWGAELEIKANLSSVNYPELTTDFYRVEFTDDSGIKQTGYIPCAFLTEYKTDDTEHKEITDPGYTEDDISKTVLITILVIALVLITLGYLTYAGTSGKNKKNKRGNNESRIENN